jgi:hypothetical protein
MRGMEHPLQAATASLTDYHAKYLAHELTKRSASDSLENLAAALAEAQVDLNPHQVDARSSRHSGQPEGETTCRIEGWILGQPSSGGDGPQSTAW